MRDLIVIAHDIRSTHNVGAILRTSDGFGVTEVLFSGYTPFPRQSHDPRLPHLADKIHRDIHKTALGAESSVPQRVITDIAHEISTLQRQGYRIVGLEQNERSVRLDIYSPPQKIALLLGEERYGLSSELLKMCNDVIEIPMQGDKESFNVSVATGIALYHLAYAK